MTREQIVRDTVIGLPLNAALYTYIILPVSSIL
jgi:hypothetical protein